jgi:pimeloyl-ACP methyl ester carboxylesterase
MEMEVARLQTRPIVRSFHGAGIAWFGLALRAVSLVSTAAAARLLERMWLTPPRAKKRPSRLPTAELQRLSCEHGELVVHKLENDGPTVYMMHGWGGRADQLADLALSLLARGFRVLAIDGPAHGMAPGRQASGVALAAALRAAVSAQGPAHALVTHSMGTFAAVLGLQHGVALPRLVFAAPPLNPRAYLQALADELTVPPAVIERLERNLERRLRFRWEQLDIVAVAPSLRGELLVIHDRDDAEVPWEHGAAIARAWPGARLLTTRGLGHRKVLRDPEVIAAVGGFIASPQAAAI